MAYREAKLQYPGLPDGLVVTDVDLHKLPTFNQLGAADGSLAKLGPGTMVVADWLADDKGMKLGSTVTLTHEGKSVPVKVVATMDSTPLNANVMIDAADLDKLGIAKDPTAFIADAKQSGETARSNARTALRSIAGDGISVAVLADQRDDLESDVNAILGILLGLIGLTVLIAVTGVGSTTALSVVERVREAGLLRAVGMARGSLRLMLTSEAAMYGLIGCALGLALGLPYAWLMTSALGKDIPISLPIGLLAGAVVVFTLLTALAGVLPARRASRVSPMAALHLDG